MTCVSINYYIEEKKKKALGVKHKYYSLLIYVFKQSRGFCFKTKKNFIEFQKMYFIIEMKQTEAPHM